MRLTEVLRQDVRDEEDELLPRLQSAVSVRRLRALGVTWEAVRRTAPTRPHRHASHASARLARVAGRIDHLGVLRQGEDPSTSRG